MDRPLEPDMVGKLRHHAKWTGYAVILVVLGVQALIGSALQTQSAVDPTTMFFNVLMFTWPLSIAVAVGVIGWARWPAVREGWGLWLWPLGLAVGALILAAAGGQNVVPASTTPAGSGPFYAIMWFISATMSGFMKAYTEPVFFGALVVGAGLAWMWLDVIDPRSGELGH